MQGHHVFGMLEGGVSVNTVDELVPLMEKVITLLNLNEVSRAFHQFDPHGATGVIVLSESHFSAHTYPEDDKVYLDLFCCSKDFKPDNASSVIMDVFGADLFQWDYVRR